MYSEKQNCNCVRKCKTLQGPYPQNSKVLKILFKNKLEKFLIYLFQELMDITFLYMILKVNGFINTIFKNCLKSFCCLFNHCSFRNQKLMGDVTQILDNVQPYCTLYWIHLKQKDGIAAIIQYLPNSRIISFSQIMPLYILLSNYYDMLFNNLIFCSMLFMQFTFLHHISAYSVRFSIRGTMQGIPLDKQKTMSRSCREK